MSRVALNPVLGREVRQRMRGFRSFGAIFVFLGLLTVTVWLVYLGTKNSDPFSFDIERQTRLGRDMFEWLLTVMLLLVVFLVPGLTSGAIAGERERQTLLPLQITPLTPRSILWGKVMASLAFLVLMIAAAIPLFAICYQLGGLRFLVLVKGVAAIVAIGVLLAAMVVAISTFSKRVQTATILAYGFTGLLVIGSGVGYGAWALADGSTGDEFTSAPSVLLVPNPLVFVATATAGADLSSGDTVLSVIRRGVAESYASNGGWFSTPDKDARFAGSSDDGTFFVAGDDDGLPAHAWLASLGSLLVLAGGLFILAARRLRVPAESER